MSSLETKMSHVNRNRINNFLSMCCIENNEEKL